MDDEEKVGGEASDIRTKFISKRRRKLTMEDGDWDKKKLQRSVRGQEEIQKEKEFEKNRFRQLESELT